MCTAPVTPPGPVRFLKLSSTFGTNTSSRWKSKRINTVKLQFTVSDMKEGKVYVSRVDGNHRLYYAAGDERRDALFTEAPFQLHIGLSQEQERSLFVDINSNQKGLNSSHLAVMQSRLTEEELEIKNHLDRWIANRLSKDPQSPWHGMIHEGGSKKGTRTQGLTRLVNFASIQGGISKLLSKSQYIHDLGDAELQYVIIRGYWQAVRNVFADEWAKHKDYLLLKNIGVWSFSILAAAIIDRCIAAGKVDVLDFSRYLTQTRARFDWSKDAAGERAVTGMSGNKAAQIIAAAMAEELTDEVSGSTRSNKFRSTCAHSLSRAPVSKISRGGAARTTGNSFPRPLK